MNEPGVSGILGLTLGIGLLGGLLVSVAICSNCEWWLALSISLVSLVSAFKWPCSELSSWTLTLFAVRWMLEVLVAISWDVVWSVLMVSDLHLSAYNFGSAPEVVSDFLCRCYDIINSHGMASSSYLIFPRLLKLILRSLRVPTIGLELDLHRYRSGVLVSLYIIPLQQFCLVLCWIYYSLSWNVSGSKDGCQSMMLV